MPSKSFNFNWILPYAIKRFLIFSCLSEIDYGIYKVLLQNTFQSSMPLLNAFFGLSGHECLNPKVSFMAVAE